VCERRTVPFAPSDASSKPQRHNVFATVPLLVLSEAGGSERGSARSHRSQLNAAPEEAMHMRHQDLSWQRLAKLPIEFIPEEMRQPTPMPPFDAMVPRYDPSRDDPYRATHDLPMWSTAYGEYGSFHIKKPEFRRFRKPKFSVPQSCAGPTIRMDGQAGRPETPAGSRGHLQQVRLRR
jgi:hypothetical protein